LSAFSCNVERAGMHAVPGTLDHAGCL